MTEAADPAALAELADAHRALLAAVAALDDAALREPSLLPGWSRGHVLTHLARNAEGMGRLVEWASTGTVTPMYASPEARAADIESGSGRPAAEIQADLTQSSARIEEQLGTLSGPALDALVEMGPSRTPTRGAQLAGLRIREVVIHHVDLGIGLAPSDWSTMFAHRTLDELVPRFAAQGAMPVAVLTATDTGRVWRTGATSGTSGSGGELSGPSTALLGWLVGRIPAADARSAGLELVGDGDVPSAPAWN